MDINTGRELGKLGHGQSAFEFLNLAVEHVSGIKVLSSEAGAHTNLSVQQLKVSTE